MTLEEKRASLIKNAKKMENEVIRPLFKSLLKNGWTLGQIYEMDIHFYLSLFKEETKQTFIDEIKLF